MFNEKDQNLIEEEIKNNNNNNVEDDVQIDISSKAKLKSEFSRGFINKFKNLQVKYKKDKKKFFVAITGIFVMLSALIGSSYAYLTYVSKTNNTVTINAGTLALVFQNETNTINLQNAVPVKDSVGLDSDKEYSFTVNNTGSIPGKYKITLDSTCVTGNDVDVCIPDQYIKVGIKVGNKSYKVVERNDKDEYIIDTGSLEKNKNRSYKMKIWLDYNTPNTYNAAGNKNVVYKGKLGLSYEQGKYVPSFIDTMKKLANKNQTINFKNPPSDTNGNGINILEGTENDANPIYFYRGFDTEGKNVVSKNNVLFGGFCWKIVRTTDTGGIKIVYNGEPTAEGKCTNTTGTATQISTSAFNSSSNSPAYNGYMYGTVYPYKSGAATEGSLFGSSFTYSGGTYTLTNTSTTKDNTHHYCCNNAEGTCATVRYYYYNNYYIELTNGKSVSDALEEMQTNTTDSTIKTAIDNWYETNLASYEEYLEDTVWCNDRSMQTTTNGWKENGSLTEYMYYGANGRVGSTQNSITPTFIPSVTCPNKNDAFTVSDTTKGNGKLDHPIALLTADELTMAGSGSSGYSNKSYLYTNQYWWALSPYFFGSDNAFGFYLYSSGNLYSHFIDGSRGVRPAVSLAPGTSFASGDGSSDTPYKVE